MVKFNPSNTPIKLEHEGQFVGEEEQSMSFESVYVPLQAIVFSWEQEVMLTAFTTDKEKRRKRKKKVFIFFFSCSLIKLNLIA